MALRTSWLAIPPTAAANGGRVPLAVRDKQRTTSAFTGTYDEGGRNKKIANNESECIIENLNRELNAHFVQKCRIHFLSQV